MSIFDELEEEYQRLQQLMRDRKTTIGENLAIQHIWAKVTQLNNHFIEKDLNYEFKHGKRKEDKD